MHHYIFFLKTYYIINRHYFIHSSLFFSYAFNFFLNLIFFKGVPVRQFMGLRPKMYSLLLSSGEEKKTAKGVSKSMIKNQLKYSMYRDCLFNKLKYNHTMKLIRSNNHELYNCDKVNKISLSCFDDKRFVKSCGVETLAFGHCDITICQNLQDLLSESN